MTQYYTVTFDYQGGGGGITGTLLFEGHPDYSIEVVINTYITTYNGGMEFDLNTGKWYNDYNTISIRAVTLVMESDLDNINKYLKPKTINPEDIQEYLELVQEDQRSNPSLMEMLNLGN